ncbi:MAG: cyclic nucleotide-binding domain-containing protein [Granulosicoccaceae bacterium]|jgi:CRP-like cAMP-binding protein
MSQSSVIVDSMHQAMQKNPIFGELLTAEDREYLLKHGTVHAVTAGTVLCKQYQRDSSVYVLINGVVEVTEQINNKTISLGKLYSGEVFGEIAALFMMPRIATVTVAKPSVVLEIPGEVLDELVERVPVLRDAVFERYRDRTIQTALKSVRIFAGLDDDTIREMAGKATIVTAKKGDVLIREGEPGDAFYIINYGVARVYTHIHGNPLNLALLRAGDYFGEWSLLTNSPRAATVAAVTQMEVVRMGSEEFMDLIDKFPDIRTSIDQIAHERNSRTRYARSAPESAQDIQVILREIEHILVLEHETAGN